MRILNLNTNPGFEGSELWQAYTTAITSLDPSWLQRSLLGRILKLLRVSRGFDVVLFHLDIRLAALFGLICRIFHAKRGLVLQGFLCDISRYSRSSVGFTTVVRNKASLLLNRLLVHTMSVVVVHTRREVDLYSEFFSAPKSRFAFIPYFHYGEDGHCSSKRTSKEDSSGKAAIVLAIGRHRDFECFVSAMAESPWHGVIVAGDSDREKLDGNVPRNVAVHYEVSRTEYRDHIERSAIVVIPLYSNRWQRSLGQIAMFEAISMNKPVVAAQTFQLADYASDDEVLYYRPGDAKHLREQIDRLVEDAGLRCRLAQNARMRLLTEFTRERYISDLMEISQSVCGFSEPVSLSVSS